MPFFVFMLIVYMLRFVFLTDFSFLSVYPVSLLGHHAIVHITSFKNRNRKTKEQLDYESVWPRV